MAREEGFFYAVERPLEQTAMESKRAHAALRDYALMGAGRSLNKLRLPS